MSNDIKIKKGLDIKLVGEAEKVSENASQSEYFTIRPDDFHGTTPKLIAKEGSKVKAGDPVFFDKANQEIKFVSPVSGKITKVERGAKRKILAIKILADKDQKYVDHGKLDFGSANSDEVKSLLLKSGCWPFIKQRPYDIIANPERSPKAIFISAHASAPLAADCNFTLKGKEVELQAAITALSKLTEGRIHVGIGKKEYSPFNGIEGITLHFVKGPHPSGNVGTLINKIDPVNKGEIVWTINPHDLVIIGELLLTGKFNAERVVA
ncbi:MAG: NADH:ubiquinone reductase (Na(+)-transporting) subunit A, partial [Flavobacteriaceae bacterium]|nr:NADH:ubiquinone reductase (Na(+)-transporting) subunit A [Flavobacteriaceae bacterium]